MTAREAEAHIREHLAVHAIRGDLKPGRTYRVAEETATSIRFVTRNGKSNRCQTLRVELVTCRSLRFGEYRRANLYWAEPRREEPTDFSPAPGKPRKDPAAPVDLRALRNAADPPAHADGTPMAVDELMGRGFAVFGD